MSGLERVVNFMDWDYHAIKLGAQQAWVCPLCGRANAPWVMQCSCMDVEVVDQSTYTYKIDYTGPHYTKISTTGDQTIYTHNPMNISTVISPSKTEENCEDCIGGCDLCYGCKKNPYKY